MVFTDFGTLELTRCNLNIEVGEDEQKFLSFTTPDGVLYVTHPMNMEGTNTLMLPFDSGRVDNHNIYSLGSDAFASTDLTDTLTIPGGLSTDYYFIQPTSSVTSGETFWVEALSGQVIVHRANGTDSGLTYNWRRFRQ